MFVDRSRGTWQISGEALDCLSRQINQERVTVAEPFYHSSLLYFMLSSLLFSWEQDTNLFHQWLSCWPCRLVYLQPPWSFSSYGDSVMRRYMGKQQRKWQCNWQNNCSKDLTFVIRKAQRRASFQKFSLQTALRGKNDDPVLKARSLKMITAATGLPFCQRGAKRQISLHFHFGAGEVVSE